jgi:hypothetical protein
MLGIFLSVLYYAEELIEEQTYREKSLWVIGLLLIIKGLLGGILIVLTFYTLQELNLSFTVFNKEIVFGLWGNLIIAGTVSIFGSDFFRIIKRRAEMLSNKEVK